MFGLDLSAKQIQRAREWYCKQIDPIVEANQVEYMVQVDSGDNIDSRTYIMVRGSMLFTREEGWKELKPGRIFNESQNVDIQYNRNEFAQSIYVSHLGSKDKSLPKLEDMFP